MAWAGQPESAGCGGQGLAANADETGEPVRTGRKDGLCTGDEEISGSTVGDEEVAISCQRLNPPPGVATGDAGAEFSAGFTRLGAIAYALLEHGLHAQHDRAGLCAA